MYIIDISESKVVIWTVHLHPRRTLTSCLQSDDASRSGQVVVTYVHEQAQQWNQRQDYVIVDDRGEYNDG